LIAFLADPFQSVGLPERLKKSLIHLLFPPALEPFRVRPEAADSTLETSSRRVAFIMDDKPYKRITQLPKIDEVHGHHAVSDRSLTMIP
jgi:hypothetical protein